MNIKDKYQKLIAELMNCRLCQEKFGFEPHPEFMERRIFEVRNIINEVLKK